MLEIKTHCDHRECKIDDESSIDFFGQDMHDLYDIIKASSSSFYNIEDYDKLIKTKHYILSCIEDQIKCKTNPKESNDK